MVLTETPSKADVVRAYWNATTTGQAENLRSIVAEDAVFHYPGNHFISGDYRGIDEVVGLYKTLWGLAEDGSFEPILHEVIPGEEFVSVVLSYRIGLLPKRYLPGRACGLLRVKDGKIHEYWLFEWDQALLNDLFRTVGLKVALKREGPIAALVGLPRAVIAAVRLGIRLFGNYTAPTNV